MNATVFDIETVSLPESELPPFDETNVALGNTKDPEKVKAKVAEARSEWLAGAALHPMTGQVAMVGFKSVGGELLIHWSEESELVEWALGWIADTIRDGKLLAGFNCYTFDLPFLMRRAWKLGLHVPPDIRQGRYWSKSIMDLREEWLLGERAPAKGTSSLDAIGRFLGLPPKLGSGADFAGLSLDERKAYITRDLEVTEALYRRLFQ